MSFVVKVCVCLVEAKQLTLFRIDAADPAEEPLLVVVDQQNFLSR